MEAKDVLSAPRQEVKDVSRALARKWIPTGYSLPRPGYETTVYADEPHDGHKRRVYLVNEGGRFWAWAWESPCLLCHKLSPYY